MKKVLSVISLLALMFGLTGCGDTLYDGNATIVKKEFTKAYSITTNTLVGKVMVPQTVFYPDSWEMLLSQPSGEEEPLERWYEVSEEQFSEILENSSVCIEEENVISFDEC